VRLDLFERPCKPCLTVTTIFAQSFAWEGLSERCRWRVFYLAQAPLQGKGVSWRQAMRRSYRSDLIRGSTGWMGVRPRAVRICSHIDEGQETLVVTAAQPSSGQ